MQIRESVTHDEFLEAVQPLLELLGADNRTIYTGVPIVIDLAGVTESQGGAITFCTAAGELNEKTGRIDGLRGGNHPQGSEWAELAHMVRVTIGGFEPTVGLVVFENSEQPDTVPVVDA